MTGTHAHHPRSQLTLSYGILRRYQNEYKELLLSGQHHPPHGTEPGEG